MGSDILDSIRPYEKACKPWLFNRADVQLPLYGTTLEPT
jgi:hypothetical protein